MEKASKILCHPITIGTSLGAIVGVISGVITDKMGFNKTIRKDYLGL